MNECSECLPISVLECQNISVKLPLDALTAYKWRITDKFGNIYEGDETTDSSGFFEIDIEDLPEGLLTKYSGFFTLEIILNDEVVSFQDGTDTYSCVLFDLTGGGSVIAANNYLQTETGGFADGYILQEDEDYINI